MSSEAEKLAEMIISSDEIRQINAQQQSHISEDWPRAFAAQIQAAIREELLTDKALVLHAEEILELQQKVEALENTNKAAILEVLRSDEGKAVIKEAVKKMNTCAVGFCPHIRCGPGVRTW